jgi:hypothetical protein
MARSERATGLASSFDLALLAAPSKQFRAERRPRDPANATYTNALAEYSL